MQNYDLGKIAKCSCAIPFHCFRLVNAFWRFLLTAFWRFLFCLVNRGLYKNGPGRREAPQSLFEFQSRLCIFRISQARGDPRYFNFWTPKRRALGTLTGQGWAMKPGNLRGGSGAINMQSKYWGLPGGSQGCLEGSQGSPRGRYISVFPGFKCCARCS